MSATENVSTFNVQIWALRSGIPSLIFKLENDLLYHEGV